MSSRTSGRMGLRGLVLGGAVAVSSFSLSGCWAAGAAWILQEDANSKRAAEAQKESARTIAEAMRENNSSNNGNVQVSYTSPGSQAERDIARYGSIIRERSEEHLFFACTSTNDLNSNGIVEPCEVSGVNNCFFVDDYVKICSSKFQVWEVVLPNQHHTTFDYILVNLNNGIILDSERNMEGLKMGKIRSYNPGFFKQGDYRAMIRSSKKGAFNSFDFKIGNSTVANK